MAISVNAITDEPQNSDDGSQIALSGFLRTGCSLPNRAPRRRQGLWVTGLLASVYQGNPPGNRLERLEGQRAGQMSIRINDQWRICFRWVNHDAHDVELVDYH